MITCDHFTEAPGSKRVQYVHLRVVKKPFKYWFPGTSVVKAIINNYEKHLDNGSILVISEKAVSVAMGNIYDESVIRVDAFSKYFTKIINAYLWSRVLYGLFIHGDEFLRLIEEIPLEQLAAHKKLSLKYGGLHHFIKPYSEAGVDTTNLPYYYVSLPLRNADKVAREIRENIVRTIDKDVNVMLVDSDRTFKPKQLSSLAISTRPSFVKGVIDLGGIGYILGKLLKNKFTEYPTPVAYDGYWLGLPRILKIARIAEKSMGHGLGRTAIDMLENLHRTSFDKVKWRDMNKIKHYPALVIKIDKLLS
ncbi:MAG: coenzyme F420-0:L-glutamate ligase [Desulfurococcaceae archaeon]|jgi:F420-0:gamma-glutamyl ligase-like protein